MCATFHYPKLGVGVVQDAHGLHFFLRRESVFAVFTLFAFGTEKQT